MRGLGYPFDIIVMAVERFEESKDVIGGIAYPANKYGKVIYEQRPPDQIRKGFVYPWLSKSSCDEG